jgi:methionine synthase I (cobalamin-dependent)
MLRTLVPSLRVLGGCCGTSHEHIAAISAACTVQRLPATSAVTP